MGSHILEVKGRDGAEVLRALSSETRLGILTLLSGCPMNINALGMELGISQPSITKHIQLLQQAGLIESEYLQGSQGMQKVCRLRYNRFILSFENSRESSDRIEEMEMPVGLYSRADPSRTCGLASRERMISFVDEPQSFFHPERANAQILWMADGYVEYEFPNSLPTSVHLHRLELSMEVCSEVADYDNDYPSDITVWINGREVGTWTSPGDLGDKRGRLNPSWWSDHATQYGLLKVWTVDREGSFVDGEAVSGVTLNDLGLVPKQSVAVRIGVKPDAEHPGGFNLFGKGFGNYEQDLLLRLHYTVTPGLRREILERQRSERVVRRREGAPVTA